MKRDFETPADGKRAGPAQGPLTIARMDAIPVRLPLAKPMRMSGVKLEHSDNLLVRIEARNGTVGWGEAASAPLAGAPLADMVAGVETHLRPLIEGKDALWYAQLTAQCARALPGSSGARAAVEMALLDLVGRHLQVPVSDLLGGALRDSVRPMWLLGNGAADENIAEAKRKQADGFDFFKLKVGVKAVDEEIEETLALRAALGASVTLCADANMGYTLTTARHYIAKTADARLLFLEQPLRDDDLSGMQALAKESAVSLGADQAISSIGDILDFQRAGAAAGMNLKTRRLGGIGITVHAGRICESLGLAVDLACKVSESSISGAALVQIGAVLANLDWGISPTNYYFAVDTVRDPVRPHGGSIAVTRAPGLGVEVLEDVIARHRLR